MCQKTGKRPLSAAHAGGENKSDPHFSAFFRIFSRIFSPARSLLTKEEMHCTFVLVYWFHPLSDW